MISRFRKITKGVYRGSAPTPTDVAWLQHHLGIKKIVSLDQHTGEAIDSICKKLGITHIKIYIEGKHDIAKLLHHNLKDLLMKGGPTYFHCHYGKDRTGLLAALFQCKYLGVKPEKALQEAKALDFGLGVPADIVHLYEHMIRSCKPVKSSDQNSADIVSNEREYVGDNRDSFLDESRQSSFSLYMDPTRQAPFDAVYNYIDEQSPTRQNYEAYKNVKPHDPTEEDVIPQVGLYNNDSGIAGAGMNIMPGGFIYD